MNINTLHITMPFNIIRVFFISAFIIFSLNGCDSDKKSTASPIKQAVQKYSTDTTLKGRVGNKRGAINSGIIKAKDSNGKVVATTELQNSNKYTLTIPAATELPLVLTFQADKSSPAKDNLISVVIYTSLKKFDINDLTTSIAKKAKQMGGYNHRNMSMAADSSVGIPDSNKTSTGFRGDPTAQYGGWH